MNANRTSFLVLLALAAASASPAQTTGPDPKEIPVPPIATKAKPLPGVDKLPTRTEMPDILTMDDGTRVTTLAQWKKRREEIKQTLEYYAVGSMPPAPGNVQGPGDALRDRARRQGEVPAGEADLWAGAKLELYIGIFTPTDGEGTGAGDHLAVERAAGRAGPAA